MLFYTAGGNSWQVIVAVVC